MTRFVSFCVLFFLGAVQAVAQQKEFVFVGTFSVRGSEGIYVYEFDPTSVSLKRVHTQNGPASPSYLELHPSGKYLYSVNRGGLNGDEKSGSVLAYAINSSTGELTLINAVASFGLGPCHVAVDPKGRFVYVSHYNEGTLAAYRLHADGSLAVVTDSIRYTGSGPNKDRQQSPHIHSVTIAPGSERIFVADLGTDRIYSYRVGADGKLRAEQTLRVSPGSGPRHMAFHPNRKHLYVAEELTSSISSFSIGSERMDRMEDGVATLPPGFHTLNTSADIHLSPDGKFLYLSNRGHDAIAIFSVQKNGKLKLVGHQESLGKTPRHFMISQDGEFMLVANQDSDNIVIFRRDKKTGLLTKAGETSLPSPVCIKMLKKN